MQTKRFYRFKAKSTKTRIETTPQVQTIVKQDSFKAKSTKTRIETSQSDMPCGKGKCFKAKSTKTRIETVFPRLSLWFVYQF